MTTASKRRASRSLASRTSSDQPCRSSRRPRSSSVKSQTIWPSSSAALRAHSARWVGNESVASCLSLVERRPYQAKRRIVGISVRVAVVSVGRREKAQERPGLFAPQRLVRRRARRCCFDLHGNPQCARRRTALVAAPTVRARRVVLGARPCPGSAHADRARSQIPCSGSVAAASPISAFSASDASMTARTATRIKTSPPRVPGR